jgi:hypothetical protein
VDDIEERLELIGGLLGKDSRQFLRDSIRTPT